MTDLSGVLEYVREEDFVEYLLFPEIGDLDERQQESFLHSVLEKCNKVIHDLIEKHLWHKDKFTLLPRTASTNKLISIDSKNGNLPPHLYGVTHFGENIEDEWLIVYILLELTKKIPKLVARVCDSDGEFLLIEAAESLPGWTKPEIMENRVYLYDGKVHIIQPESLEEESKLEINEAIRIVLEDTTKSVASNDIQTAILNRIEGYPNKIEENLHTARVYVPIGVAAILKHDPQLISAVVHAFCNRDTIDMKVCRAMKFFPPENRVYTNITFSKCLYAMLTHSKFVPDKRTGWDLPLPHTLEYKSHSLGVKIACGFEILVSQAKPSQDLETDKAWQKYLTSLKEKNYFNNLLEHSRDYNNLLNKAKEYYIHHHDEMYSSPLIGRKILDFTKSIDYNFKQFKNAEQTLSKEDDDSWLNISSEELDEYLQTRYGQKKVNSFNNNSEASSFTQKINSFLNHVSDVDGAEFPNTQSPIRPPRNKKSKGKSKVSFSEVPKQTESNSTNKINFDPNSFSCAVQNILNFVIPEDDNWNLESDSEMSDYEDDNFVKNDSYESVKTKMQAYMDEMDKELAGTTIGESFVKKNGDVFEDIESFTPVDIDMNALKNILESYKSQLGEAGPSSNMLGPMGVHLDVSKDKL